MDYALIAEESVVLDLRGGTTKVIPCNGRSGIALAASMSDENEHTVIGVRGLHSGLTIGAEDAGKVRSATKTNGQAVADIDFVGDDVGATVRGVSIGQAKTPAGKSNRDFRFSALTIDARMLQCGIITFAGSILPGYLELEDITILAQNVQGVNRTKWGVRHNASGTKIVAKKVKGGKLQEHLLYLDALQDGSLIEECHGWECGRTMLQIVTRYSTKPGGENRVPSNGTVTVRRNVAEDIGYYSDDLGTDQGEGASAFTCAGHRGTLILDSNVHLDTEDRSSGSAVVFMDRKMLELDPNDPNPKTSPILGNGYALTSPAYPGMNFGLDRLVMIGNSFHSPNSDRDCVAVSGVRQVEVYPYSVNSNKCPLHLEHNGDRNGAVLFRGRAQPSAWIPSQFGSGVVKRNGSAIPATVLDASYVAR